MAAKIDTVGGRDRLKPRREPYWQRIVKGCYIGFRKASADTAGTWVARAYDEAASKQSYRALGVFDELPEHQRFDAAVKAAREWFDHLGRGGAPTGATVKDICERYVEHLRRNKRDKAAADAERRFKVYVLDDPAFAALDVTRLTPLHVERWVERLRSRSTKSGASRGHERTESTLNRDVTPFRAALNLAHDDGLVTSDFAWRVKLRPLPDADRRRDLYLDRDQRRKLIAAARADLALLVTGMSLLPLRPGALAALKVGDFDQRLGVLRVPADKAGAGRAVKLPAATAEFFAAAARGKLPAAPLLARADGKAWDKDAWKWPMKDAVEAAKLPPAATLYTLRHSTITDLVHAGADLLTVAQVAGTSVRMIEKHYGHLRDSVATDALRALAL
jgi:integrase